LFARIFFSKLSTIIGQQQLKEFFSLKYFLKTKLWMHVEDPYISKDTAASNTLAFYKKKGLALSTPIIIYIKSFQSPVDAR